MVEWLWFGTTLSVAQIVAGIAILTAVAMALAPKNHVHLDRAHLYRGSIFGVLAAIGQGGGAVLSRKAFLVTALAGERVDGGTAAYQRILGGVGVAAIYFVLLRVRDRHTRDKHCREWRKSWPWVLINVLGVLVLGVSCYQWALSTTPSGIVLPIVATTPLAVMPIAYRVEGDRPAGQSIIGGMIAVAGVIALTLVR